MVKLFLYPYTTATRQVPYYFAKLPPLDMTFTIITIINRSRARVTVSKKAFFSSFPLSITFLCSLCLLIFHLKCNSKEADLVFS